MRYGIHSTPMALNAYSCQMPIYLASYSHRPAVPAMPSGYKSHCAVSSRNAGCLTLIILPGLATQSASAAPSGRLMLCSFRPCGAGVTQRLIGAHIHVGYGTSSQGIGLFQKFKPLLVEGCQTGLLACAASSGAPFLTTSIRP